MKTIIFSSGHLNERGTDVALFKYAYYNQKILGNQSIILGINGTDQSARDKFAAEFEIIDIDEKDTEVAIAPADAFYVHCHGQYHSKVDNYPRPKNGKTIIHTIMRANAPHGDIYATSSKWVANHYGPGVGNIPIVPYIVHLPSEDRDIKEQLNIPKDALVIGRYGGMDTFSIVFVAEAIAKTLANRKDIFFLFANTPIFIQHPRAIFLDKIIDEKKKVMFINTCDAMLHARFEGETFGLAIAEFSIRNKPVLTWDGSIDREHIDILGDRGWYYTSENLEKILMELDKDWIDPMYDFNAYRDYSPKKVMKQFDEVFLR